MKLAATDAIGPALDHTSRFIASPWRLTTWMWAAVGIGLLLCGEGVPPAVGLFFEFGLRWVVTWNVDALLSWIRDNTLAFTVYGCAAACLLMIPYLLCRWLSSRGQFIVFDNVIHGQPRVAAPWHEWRELAYSFFKFRISWDLLLFNAWLVVVVIAGAIAWKDIWDGLIAQEYQFRTASTLALIFLVLAIPAVAVIQWVASSLVFDLAIPLMYVRRINAWPAVKLAYRELFRPHRGPCLRYFLMMTLIRMLAGTVTGLLMFIILLVTCLIAYVILLIPIVGNYPVGLASVPMQLFETAFKFHFLEQFGEAYRV